MLAPGNVIVVDMHGLESPQHRNLAISELLRGVMESQDKLYSEVPADKKPKTVVIVEEAHEFLSGAGCNKCHRSRSKSIGSLGAGENGGLA